MALSFEDLQQRLSDALLERFGNDANGYRRYWLCATFPDYIIARGRDEELLQISYDVDANGVVTLSEPQEVETAYLPVQESAKFVGGESASEDGLTWPIQVMQGGFAEGEVQITDPRMAALERLPHYFPNEVVAQVAEACNNARFGRRHPFTEGEETDASRVAGYLDNGRVKGNAALATMHLFENEKEIQAKLVAARSANKLDLFGASIFAYFAWRPGKAEGRNALVARKLMRLVSVDLVTEAGAGGKVLAYAASRSILAEIASEQRKVVKEKVSPGSTRENGGTPTTSGPAVRNSQGGAMKDYILKVLEALRKIDSGSAAELEKEFQGLTEDKHAEFFAKVSLAVSTKMPTALATSESNARSAADTLADAARGVREKQDAEIMAKTRESLAAAKKSQFVSTLDRKLGESKLPVPAASLVREHFAKATGEESDKDVDGYIAKVRESFAAYESVGQLTGRTVEVGRDSRDKLQLAADAMMGVKEALKDRAVRPFRGIKEAYIHLTGDADLRFDKGGVWRVSEAVSTADFPNILLNSMTKRMIQDYEELRISDGLDVLYTKSTLGDYKSQDRIRMGYLSDLATVTEGNAYVEMTKPTDEKISYTPVKRGNLVTISEETIRNDDLGKISGYASRLGRAARHTLAVDITNKFITPPNYDPDGVAWFHATHSNLGAAGLSAAELDVRKVALYKQAEKDSGNRLGLRLWGIMIPADLEPTARQINNNQSGTNNWYQQFGADGERILVNPILTDVNDWFYYCNPSIAPFLEVGFLDGYDTPQIFIANLPTQGTQFTNDQIQYKAKFVWGVKPIDFRGVGKEVV